MFKNDVSRRWPEISPTISRHKIIYLFVYFPCFEVRCKYGTKPGHYLGFIDDLIRDNNDAIINGVMNFECRINHPGFVKCNIVFGAHTSL